jgi:hypothetical protein
MMPASQFDFFCTVLSRTIVTATTIITRPSMLPRIDELAELTGMVDQARRVMVEGGNPVREEVPMLLEACCHIEQERMNGKRGELRAAWWCAAAGVLLQMVRENFTEAMVMRAAARPSTTSQDYRK